MFTKCLEKEIKTTLIVIFLSYLRFNKIFFIFVIDVLKTRDVKPHYNESINILFDFLTLITL